VKNLFNYTAVLFFIFLSQTGIYAQTEKDTAALVQFSGVVVMEENKTLIPLPFTNVFIQGSNRGTYTNLDGFFSIVARKGDVIEFTSVGFKTVVYKIPINLKDNRYSIYQLMVEDTINLPVTMIYPWPSKEHFKIEFLAMDIKNAMYDRALANINEDRMEELRQNLKADGGETGSLYLRQQAREYYHQGQLQPMNILNPLAWRDFFKAWQEGKFKAKKDK
jgi:hypothetical protein